MLVTCQYQTAYIWTPGQYSLLIPGLSSSQPTQHRDNTVLNRQASISVYLDHSIALMFVTGRNMLTWCTTVDSPGIQNHAETLRGTLSQPPLPSPGNLHFRNTFPLLAAGSHLTTILPSRPSHPPPPSLLFVTLAFLSFPIISSTTPESLRPLMGFELKDLSWPRPPSHKAVGSAHWWILVDAVAKAPI